MTRRDYISFCAAILRERDSVDRNVPPAQRGMCNATLDNVAMRLADVMADDNDRFDRGRFYIAAGVGR